MPISKTYLTRYLAEKGVRKLTEVAYTKSTRKPDNVIILQSGFESLEQFLSPIDFSSLEVPRVCPECGGKLWKNGSYRRICLALHYCAVLTVQRVVCKNCSRSGSCLFDFLVPYKRYESSALANYVNQYFSGDSAYRDSAWCDADGEREDAEASLSRAYRAVSDACDSAEHLLLQAQRVCIEEGLQILEADREVTPQETRARSQTRARLMSFLVLALRLIGRLCSRVKPSWLFLRKYMSKGYAFPRLGFKMSGPQSLKHALF